MQLLWNFKKLCKKFVKEKLDIELVRKTPTMVTFFKTLQITALEDKLTEQKGNINTSSVFVGQEKLMEAKAQLAELARLSEHWESSKLTDETNLEEMKRRCSEFEIIESGKEMLESRVEMLELELEDLESERREWLER